MDRWKERRWTLAAAPALILVGSSLRLWKSDGLVWVIVSVGLGIGVVAFVLYWTRRDGVRRQAEAERKGLLFAGVAALMVRDLDAFAPYLERMPPRGSRLGVIPRIELVGYLQISERGVVWTPNRGAQRLGFGPMRVAIADVRRIETRSLGGLGNGVGVSLELDGGRRLDIAVAGTNVLHDALNATGVPVART